MKRYAIDFLQKD